jgi:hypothetical protein
MPKRRQKREGGSEGRASSKPSAAAERRVEHPNGSLQVLPHRYRLTGIIRPVNEYL